MVERVSALEGHHGSRRVGSVGKVGAGVVLSEQRIGSLWQLASWPDRLNAVGAAAAQLAGVEKAPAPGRVAVGSHGRLIRVEALKWLLERPEGAEDPSLPIENGTVLDLSHARTLIRIEGSAASELITRLVAIDIRPVEFPEGAAAQTAYHGVGLTLIRRGKGFDILVFRSFALTLWEELAEIGAQFGCEIA
ncbi:MAG: sarcosine oxidase subunit gamma family protein [Pseudomonadota bacterium]